MAVKFTNNARTTLAADISNSATTATVTSGSVFPVLNAGEYFYCTFDNGTNNEIVKVTARSGNTLTIVRGVDNTTARAFSTDDAAELRATAGLLTDIQENIAAKSANQTVYNATTASSATDYDIGIDPGLESNAMVFLNGVMQHHDTFSFSGSTLTFDTAPSNGLALEVIVDNLINLQSSNLTVDTFTAADVGGNPQVDFVLSDAPAGETNLIVFVDGVFQANDTYTISSTTLSMTDGVTADMTVTVYVMNPVNIGAPSDNTVTSSKLSGNITMPADLTVTGDVAFDSPTFVVDNANSRVGLGTASPSVPVDIVGDVKMSANLTVDTTTLVVDSTNNRVGIGTTSPAMELDVRNDGANGIAEIGVRGGTNGAGVVQISGHGTTYGSTSFDLIQNSAAAYVFQRANLPLILGTNATERLRINSSGSVGIGTTPVVQLHVTDSQEQLTLSEGGARGATFDYRSSTGNLNIATNGINARTSPQFTLDLNGKVGIGTASPAEKLHVAQSTADNLILKLEQDNASYESWFEANCQDGGFFRSGISNNTNNYAFFNTDQASLLFLLSGSEKMRIDSATSNVGIGTTSPSQALEVTGITLSDGYRTAADNTNYSLLTRNSSNTAVYIQQAGSGNILDVQSGSAGAGQGTSRLLVKSDGKVGIGATSPQEMLTVNSGTTVSSFIQVTNATLGTGDNAGLYVGVQSDEDGYIGMRSNQPLAFATNNTERMRIDTSGDIAIGSANVRRDLASSTSPVLSLEGTFPAINLRDSGTGYGGFLGLDGNTVYIGGHTNTAAIQFYVNGSEKMRLMDYGTLCVGMSGALTDGGPALAIKGDGVAASPAAEITKVDGTTSSSAVFVKFWASSSGTGMGQIVGNGSGNVQFAAFSDKRLKENINPLSSSLDKVLALNPVSFDWKENNEHIPAGFIAQEVEEILPEYVSVSEDPSIDLKEIKSLTGGMTSGYIAVLTKAIQEQQTQIETLKQEIREIKESG